MENSAVVSAATVSQAGSEVLSPAGPWSRFFARAFDNCLVCLVGFGILLLSGLDQAQIAQHSFLFSWLLLLGWIIIESCFLTVFGSTPGKGILNISVARSDGEELHYPHALQRSLRVWLWGLGMALPLLSLIGNVVAYNRLKRSGITLWDEKGGFSVMQGPLGFWRVFFFIIALPLVWVGLVVLSFAVSLLRAV